ncbi:MAG TPA: hypothetical protein DD490_20220 [Acidobacteria bacterium]|nr:hypothetical protein [Acidobacteriota bacterium]
MNGPAVDARLFADWLRSRHVPEEQVKLLLALDKKDPLKKGLLAGSPRALPASRNGVRRALNWLHAQSGDLLILFWGGHGILGDEKNRRLFYPDATTDDKQNLDLDDLLASLRTSYFAGFPLQICVIDACANHVEDIQTAGKLPKDTLSSGGPLSPEPGQFVLLAGRAGEVVTNLEKEGRGLFSKIVLEELEVESNWPPDMDALKVRVWQRFESLRVEGRANQTPIYRYHRDWSGSEQPLTDVQALQASCLSQFARVAPGSHEAPMTTTADNSASRKIRIFISHIAKDQAVLAAREALLQALNGTADYEVLPTGVTLPPGVGWRSRINAWLEACDAAIVFLSEDALKSPRVTYETSVLAHRCATWDSSLLILPVVLGDVTPESLQKSYLQEASLREVQFVRGTPAEIAEKVLEQLKEAPLCDRTAVERRAKTLAELLKGIPDDVLQEAADKVNPHLSFSISDLRLRLAIQLLGLGMAEETGQALKVFRSRFPPKIVERVIQLIGASWVDLRCASRIPAIAKGSEKPLRAFGINAQSWSTAQMYILSASQEDKDRMWHSVSCTAVYGEDVGELIQQIRTALKARLNSPTDEDLLRDLEALDEDRQPVVLGLREPGIDEAMLSQLRDEFPRVTFFLYAGGTTTEGTSLSPSLFEPLFPQLFEIEEATVLAQYDKFYRKNRLRPEADARFPHGL